MLQVNKRYKMIKKYKQPYKQILTNYIYKYGKEKTKKSRVNN